MDDVLVHEGVKRRSGRYPWGSGENPFQHEANWYGSVKDLRKKGLTDQEIAKGYGLTIQEFRNEIALARVAERESKRSEALKLQAKGLGYSAIGKEMGINESSVRSLLAPVNNKQTEALNATISVLRRNVDTKNYIDIGKGVPSSLGVSDAKFKAAVQALQKEGYTKHYIQVPQASNPANKTTITVLAKPDTTYSEIYQNKDKIGIINERFVERNGKTLMGLDPIQHVSSKRIEIVTREDGGAAKDGIVEIRRGAEGFDLGDAHYAQVRIGVDGTHFIKGVAIYSDEMPKGVDVRVYSNKPAGKDKLAYLKELKSDPNNPFGSYIKAGGQRGHLNIVREEGDWDTWSRSLSSQFLSKQSVTLAKRQLKIAEENRMREFKELQSLTNPTIKKHLLAQFADQCDTDAVVLKAAAMPNQSSHLLLPINSLKPNEIYARNYNNGETVVLIRHPHGGTFEIPELKVNNRNKEAISILGNARDAVGIHSSVAQRLSGADFDGDTVIVIPNNGKNIRNSPALKGLKDFDPQTEYAGYPGMKTINPKHMQKQMGVVSNLITDMTLQRAPAEDIAKAVRHSMVIIDSEKHGLDYKRSFIENDIAALKEKYQKKDGGRSGGASTLISRAKSEIRVPERKRWNFSSSTINPETGEKIFTETGRYKRVKVGTDPKTGKGIWKESNTLVTTKSTRMAEAKDARELLSLNKTAMEVVYSEYANNMKALGGKARKEALSVKEPPRSKAAQSVYTEEIRSLKEKVATSKAYHPYERKAQAVTDVIVQGMRRDNPTMDKDDIKKAKNMVLAEQRARLGGTRPKVTITDKEWTAIQNGAVSPTVLREVLNYADQDALKERALPKNAKQMTPAKLATAKARLRMGYTQKEVAESLGVSVASLKNALYS